MADDAFASFERKWLDANPEQAAVLVFLAADERRRAAAFGALVHELVQTAFAIRETQVAAAKLSWWQQELRGACDRECASSDQHRIVRRCACARDRCERLDARWSTARCRNSTNPAPPISRSFVNRYGRFYRPVAAVENALTGRRAPRRPSAWRISGCARISCRRCRADRRWRNISRCRWICFARHGVARARPDRATQHARNPARFHRRSAHDARKQRSPQRRDASIGRRVRARSDLKLADDGDEVGRSSRRPCATQSETDAPAGLVGVARGAPADT